MPNTVTLHPKTLFLIDSIGAMLTAFLLLVVLRTYHLYFGMPLQVLLYLSLIAVVFASYSFVCFIWLPKKWQPFMRAIGFANLLYCLLTAALVIYHYPQLTLLGLAYFISEIVVICGLVFVELKTAASGGR